jgi:hypothetical protein
MQDSGRVVMVATFPNAMFVTVRAVWDVELARVDIAPGYVLPSMQTAVINVAGY